MRKFTKRIAAALSVLPVAFALSAGSAQAQPVVTGGLVNVTLVDVVDVNNNQVIAQVPIGVAANICGVNAAVLAQGEQSTDPVCNARNNQLPRAFQQ
jgi:glucose uptake protein GlcU